jgi:hypothetical protein
MTLSVRGEKAWTVGWTTELEELLRDAIAAVYWFDKRMFVHAVECLGASSRARGLEGLAEACMHAERSVQSGSPVALGHYLGLITAAYRAADLSLSTRSRQEDN